MMTLHRYPDPRKWAALSKRPVADLAALEKPVRKILDKVKRKGDKAVLRFTKELDGVRLSSLIPGDEEWNRSEKEVSPELKKAIGQAKKNIETFHLSQQHTEKRVSTQPGVVCWQQAAAIEKVGLYIPGGSAPLFSTILMLAVPAKLAGCEEILLFSPPGKEGTLHPAILYTARLCGVTKIFKAGGVQAIAAMAYGTASVPKVSKLFGPGNQYVTLAKQLVQQEGVAIDMPAGPSEVLVIADETAVPAFVAADLLSQAEHGNDSQVILVTTSESLVEKVIHSLQAQLKSLPRKKTVEKALQHSRVILVKDADEAIAFANTYAPEHLILAVKDAENAAAKVKNAGSVFLGNFTPESAGDYASGTNHTLPTNGYAAMYSGISLDSFTKKISFQQISREGLQQLGETVMTMAAAEGLEAHRNAVAIRLNDNYAC